MEKNVNQPQPVKQLPTQPHSSPKLFIILGVIVLLVLVGAGSYMLGSKINQPQPVVQLAPQVAESTPIPTTDPKEVKTYTNTDYLFTFTHPADIIVSQSFPGDNTSLDVAKDTKGQGLGNLPSSSIGFLILPLDGNLQKTVIGEGNINFHKWRYNEFKELSTVKIGESKLFDPLQLKATMYTYKRLPDTTINNHQAKIFEKTNKENLNDINEKIIYIQGNYIYVITFTPYSNYGEAYEISPQLFDQILSSFKFTP